jgi:hypothetical protein
MRKVEDIRSPKSKDRQYNYQTKKDKGKLKIEPHESHQKLGINSGAVNG